MPSTALVRRQPDTPDQQAATAHLFNDARRIALADYRRYGRIGHAAEAADVARATMRRWIESDPEFARIAAEARLNLADELASKGIDAIRNATPSELLNHPNLYFHEMNFLEPGRRPNAAVQVDARSVTVNVLSEEQAEAVARALAGYSADEPLA